MKKQMPFLKRLNARLHHKVMQTQRISRQGFEFFFLIVGAALVSLSAFIFAKMTDIALLWNHQLTAWHSWITWILLPLGLPIVVFLTRRYAPYTSGGGIPQVIAAIHLPNGRYKTQLVNLPQTLLKIPLTSLGILCGASSGREGPSVQVGAAVMVAWGKWCKKHNYAFSGLQENNLLAIGAAGSIAAAFNAPLAGVIFAIEELGRGKALRWEKQILIGVVASGLLMVSIEGNSPYFPVLPHQKDIPHVFLWVVICALICGITGGIFARALSKGITHYIPFSIRHVIPKHPYIWAVICGLVIATIGTIYGGQTYGSGYHLIAQGLEGDPNYDFGTLGIGKWIATVFSQWSGIPGGIFTPALSIGAIVGQTIGTITGMPVPPDFLVLLCMAAFLASATQFPLTASVIVMELTGTQSELFWMLLCAIMASIISRQFSPKPFYFSSSSRFVNRMRDLQHQEYQTMVEEIEASQERGEHKLFR